MSYKVLIAEDHQLIIAGYRLALDGMDDLEVIGTANDGRQAVKMIEQLQPDLLLLDLLMPKMDGLKVLEYMRRNELHADVLVVSMISDPVICRKVMCLGVCGFLLKHADQRELRMAVKNIRSGKRYFSPEFFDNGPVILEDSNLPKDQMVGLTEREKEVLQRIALGMTNKEIACQLFLSHKTVDTHRMNLLKKINVRNVAGLVRYAVLNGFVAGEKPNDARVDLPVLR